MRIVDIFLAAPKTDARGVIATLLSAHGFDVRWQTPWRALAERGSNFGAMFGLANPLAVKFGVGVEIADGGEDVCVLRLERRIHLGQNQASISLQLADEFENLCDEVMLAFSADDQVTQVVTYGAGSLVVVDPHQAKPPPPSVPRSQASGLPPPLRPPLRPPPIAPAGPRPGSNGGAAPAANPGHADPGPDVDPAARHEGIDGELDDRLDGGRDGGLDGRRDGGRDGGLDGGRDGGLDGGLDGRRDVPAPNPARPARSYPPPPPPRTPPPRD